MTLRYIDAHCHLQFPDYADDRDVVIARMAEEGVAGVVVGCDLASSEAAVLLTEKYEHLYAAVGQHPNHVEDWDAVRFEELAHLDVVVSSESRILESYSVQSLVSYDRIEQARQ